MKAVMEGKRIPLGLFVTCLLAYLLVWSGHHYSIDGMLLFQTAKPLAFKGSLRMEPPVVWGSQVVHVSKYGVGLPALYAPVLWLLGLTVLNGEPILRNAPFQLGVRYNKALLADPAYRYASLLHPLVTALTAVLLYWFAVRLGFSQKKSVAAALIFGLASPALPYAKFDYSQPLCALFLLAAFYGLASARESGKVKWLALSGVASGMLLLTRNEFLFLQFGLLLPGIFWIFSPGKLNGWRQAARAAAVYACSTAPWIIVLFSLNRIRFGSWFSTGYPVLKFAFNVPRILAALTGNLVSPGRGMLIYFPAVIFSVFCWPRVRKNKVLAVMLAAIAAAFLFYSVWKKWGAGICWGPRFLIPYLPLLSVLSLSGFESMTILPGRARATAAGILVALGGIFSLQGSLFNFNPYYQAIFISGVRPGIGDYNFSWRYSPLVSGWGGLFQPAKYDVFWLRSYAGGDGSLWPLFLLGIGLGVLAASWLKYFKRPLRHGETDR